MLNINYFRNKELINNWMTYSKVIIAENWTLKNGKESVFLWH